MSTFLLLLGLTLFISGAGIYLAHAARNDSRWLTGLIIFPPTVLLYYRRNWPELWPAGLLQSSGIAMAVAGTLMMLFQSVQPESVLAGKAGEVFSSNALGQRPGFVDSERALKLLIRHGPGKSLGGRVHGETFQPDRIELIDGVLRLREGEGFFPQREIAIFLGEDLQLKDDRIKYVITPETDNAPDIYLSWLNPKGEPVSAIYRHDYRLEIDLAPQGRTTMSGFLQVILPDQRESYAAGDIIVATSHLRYQNDAVDRQYNHEDTLRFVAEEHIRSTYPVAETYTIEFRNITMNVQEKSGSLQATVMQGSSGDAKNLFVKVARKNTGWAVSDITETKADGLQSVEKSLLASSEKPVQKIRPSADAYKATTKTLAFEQLASLTGQGAMVEYQNGRKEQGVLRGLRKDRLVIEVQKSGGIVEYLLSHQDLKQLKMNNGDLVKIAGGAPSTTSIAPAPAPTTIGGMPVGASTAAETTPSKDGDYTSFMNKSVKVLTKDGKSVVGVLRGVNAKNLVVETMVGSGNIDYNIPVSQLVSIEFVSRQ